jgi:hypothetical protein
MVIIETPIFTKLIIEMMTDDEYKYLQEALILRPEAGQIIKGSGGLRKLRWAIQGRGKSGGARIIYYWQNEDSQIYMLLAYAKNKSENLSESQLQQLKFIVQEWSK